VASSVRTKKADASGRVKGRERKRERDAGERDRGEITVRERNRESSNDDLCATVWL